MAEDIPIAVWVLQPHGTAENSLDFEALRDNHS